MRATLRYCGGHIDGFIGVSLGHLFNFGGTFMDFTQAQRLDEIEPALIKWLSGYLAGYQLLDFGAWVLIPPVAGPVRPL